jgi:hypothetical protein
MSSSQERLGLSIDKQMGSSWELTGFKCSEHWFTMIRIAMLSGGCYGVSWNTSALRMHLSGIKLASAMGEAWQECNEGKDQG